VYDDVTYVYDDVTYVYGRQLTPMKSEMKAATVRKISVGSFIASIISFHRGS